MAKTYNTKTILANISKWKNAWKMTSEITARAIVIAIGNFASIIGLNKVYLNASLADPLLLSAATVGHTNIPTTNAMMIHAYVNTSA